MSDSPPLLTDVHFEQSPDRLKIVLPVKRSVPLMILFSVLVLLWLGMMIGGIIYTIQIAFSGASYAIVFTIMLLVFLFVLYRFGRYLLRQWSGVMANREILFINKEVLILRRPISFLGTTDAYDMQYVTPFYINAKPAGPAFGYGNRHYFFGGGLSGPSVSGLVDYLNRTYFPNREPEATASGQ